MKVDLCDLKRLLRADFFAKDRDVTLQTNRSVYIEGGGEITVPIGGIILWSNSIASIPTGWQICDGTNGTPDLRNNFPIGAGDTYAVDATGGSTTKDLSHTHGPGTLNTDNDIHSHGPGTLNTDNDTHDHNVDTGSSGGGTNHTHGPGSLATGGPSATSLVEVFAAVLVTPAHELHTHSVTSGTTAIETSHTHGSGSYNTDNDTHDHDVNSGVTADDTHDHDVNSGATASGGSATQDIMPPFRALAYIMRLT